MPEKFNIKKYKNSSPWLPENFRRGCAQEGLRASFDWCFHNNDNLIFFNIPKNASSSVRNYFRLNKRESFFKIKNIERYKKLMVIRNPYDRIISSFNEVIKCRKDGPRWETQQCEWFHLQKNNLEAGFEMFLDYISDNIYDPHIHRQIDYLNEKEVSLEEIDFLLLFEDLRREINAMPSQLRPRGGFPHINRSKNRSIQNNSLEDLINKDANIKSKIENIYKDDIIMYQKLLKIKGA